MVLEFKPLAGLFQSFPDEAVMCWNRTIKVYACASKLGVPKRYKYKNSDC